MAEIVCVLYPDRIGGYPPEDLRDGILAGTGALSYTAGSSASARSNGG
jgi:hypothetical protein